MTPLEMTIEITALFKEYDIDAKVQVIPMTPRVCWLKVVSQKWQTLSIYSRTVFTIDLLKEKAPHIYASQPWVIVAVTPEEDVGTY